MFANAFQTGFLSVFYSVGSSPLSIWDKQVKNGHIRRIVDDEVKSLVLEISGTNVATTYITTPIKPRASLGIRLPFLVLIVKNMKKYFTFEIQILDDKDMHRRFRVSNFQSTTKVRPFCTTMPIGLSSGWNQIQFNLADFTRRAYGTVYIETMRVQIHANTRIRRIYFSDRLYSDEEMPSEYKLFMPTKSTSEPRRPSRDSATRKPTITTEEPAVKRTSGVGATGTGTAGDQEATKESTPVVEPIDIPLDEEDIPSGAPPTPADTEMASPDAGERTDEDFPTDEALSPTSEAGDVGPVDEPPSDVEEEIISQKPSSPAGEQPAEVAEGLQAEGPLTTEATTTEATDTEATDASPEASPQAASPQGSPPTSPGAPETE